MYYVHTYIHTYVHANPPVGGPSVGQPPLSLVASSRLQARAGPIRSPIRTLCFFSSSPIMINGGLNWGGMLLARSVTALLCSALPCSVPHNTAPTPASAASPIARHARPVKIDNGPCLATTARNRPNQGDLFRWFVGSLVRSLDHLTCSPLLHSIKISATQICMHVHWTSVVFKRSRETEAGSRTGDEFSFVGLSNGGILHFTHLQISNNDRCPHWMYANDQ
jgi:hypothetical protein